MPEIATVIVDYHLEAPEWLIIALIAGILGVALLPLLFDWWRNR